MIPAGVAPSADPNKKARFPGLSYFEQPSCSGRADIRGLISLGTRRLVEGHLLVFLERLEAIALDRGEMREQIPSSGVMKPKPLASLNHLTVPDAIFIRP
jgi:hypothetical protein